MHAEGFLYVHPYEVGFISPPGGIVRIVVHPVRSPLLLLLLLLLLLMTLGHVKPDEGATLVDLIDDVVLCRSYQAMGTLTYWTMNTSCTKRERRGGGGTLPWISPLCDILFRQSVKSGAVVEWKMMHQRS